MKKQSEHPSVATPRNLRHPGGRWLLVLACCASLLACGGGEGSGSTASSADGAALGRSAGTETITAAQLAGSVLPEDMPTFLAAGPQAALPVLPDVPTTQRDAVRLADQASFGSNEALAATIMAQGPAKWVSQQMSAAPSLYTSGGTNLIHRHTSQTVDFCANRGNNCWRDWYSSTPLLWDFYRNAVNGPDQLRQRVALALQQILVVSNVQISSTYGLRYYHNMLLSQAFGNYRNILRSVALSPVMGDYLNNVNNDKTAPNENFARELLQLFSLGTCELNLDGTLKGGSCTATYNNQSVREYAHALTGWTYPAGGATPWGCWPQGSNCQFHAGNMAPLPAFHDSQPRTLLAGVRLAAGHTPELALNTVINSLMRHPNTAPFVSKQLIQHLVMSNPPPAYVQRVAQAFIAGQFQGFGSGVRGDMQATIAAILLDPEARDDSPPVYAGHLREPVLLFTGVLRGLNGRTDGDALGWWWGEVMRQHIFRSPSVFNFYPPNYPVAGTPLLGPAFAIHTTNTALQRLNFINYLLFWNGSGPNASVPNAVGTQVVLTAFTADAGNPPLLVDRLSRMALGTTLPLAARAQVIAAVRAYTTANSGTAWRQNRVRQAAYLVFASPQYQLSR
jgi:uncharacterized protein (DUF1800 family)